MNHQWEEQVFLHLLLRADLSSFHETEAILDSPMILSVMLCD